MRFTRILLFILLLAISNLCFAWQQNNTIGQSRNMPDKDKDTVLIRFDYKQSALYHTFTFDVLDSIINVLKTNKAVTIGIDGYAYKDEGSDTICYYLSLNRALFIQTYILGRGVDSSRIIAVTGHGKTKPLYKGVDKDGFKINCRAEITVNYPPRPKEVVISDRDRDGIADEKDKCPDVFGYAEKGGCPNEGFVLIPFDNRQSNLFTTSYKILDSVISVLMQNPAVNILIEGHAYKTEGISSVCDRLATERATIVKDYLLSRRIDISRIDTIRSVGSNRPLNAGNTPQDILLNSRTEIYFSNPK